MEDFICGYVAVAGRPNVGKSTLVNKLLRFPLSIITAKPQTTRHKVLGILSGEGYQVIFLDSPGILPPKYTLQKLMVKSAWSAIEEADLVLLLTEPLEDDFNGEAKILDKLRQLNKKVILAINKIDLVKKPSLLPIIDYYSRLFEFQEIVPISALKEDGLDLLKDVILKYLPHQPPFYPPDEITDRPQRFFVGEIIRQTVFESFGEEIPYSVAVVIDEYQERTDGKDYIRATIICEKPGQKAILIGKGGSAIKRIGQVSREQIEAFIGKPVYLELRVDVRKNWRKDEKAIKRFGQV